MGLLSEEEIGKALAPLEEWEHEGDEIFRVFEFGSFADAMAFVNKVADKAEDADHHPDILIEYNHVSIALSTRSEGGITDRDISLANTIEKLV